MEGKVFLRNRKRTQTYVRISQKIFDRSVAIFNLFLKGHFEIFWKAQGRLHFFHFCI